MYRFMENYTLESLLTVYTRRQTKYELTCTHVINIQWFFLTNFYDKFIAGYQTQY